MKISFLTLIVFALLATGNGQVMSSSGYFQDNNYGLPPPITTEKEEIDGNCYLTNTISIGEFIPDNTCSSNASFAFMSAFASDKDVIFIPKGCYLISNNLIIPEGKKLVFEKGAILNVTGGLLGNFTEIQAWQNQIFTLNSNVSGTWRPHNGSAYVEWFGAKGDGTGTYDMAAFQKTLEVFCKPLVLQKGDGTSWSDVKMMSVGSKVVAFGYKYVVEQTLEFPEYGDLRIGDRTVMIADTNDFFDTYINIRAKPYNLHGGTFVTRPYQWTTGYYSSAMDSAAKVEFSYTENPVIRIYLYQPEPRFQFAANDDRFRSGLSNITIRPVMRNTFASPDVRKTYAYKGIYISVDSTIFMTPTTEFRRGAYYRIMDYQAGDDFNNLYLLNSVGYTGLLFECTAYEVADTWTNGSIVKEVVSSDDGDVFDNIFIRHADTAIFIVGDIAGGSSFDASLWDNVRIDGAWGRSLVLGKRANAHTFSNFFIQGNWETLGAEIDIWGSHNSVKGFLFDSASDSAVRLLGVNGVNNNVDLNKRMFRARQSKEVAPLWQNKIGWSATHVKPNANEDGHYNFIGTTMAVGFQNNWKSGKEKVTEPRAVLDVVSNPSASAVPPIVAEVSTTNNGSAETALVVKSSTSAASQTVGSGVSIDFVTSKNSDTAVNSNLIGRITANLDNATDDYNNSSIDFSVQKAGTLSKVMRITSDGEVEINGKTSVNMLHLTPTAKPDTATVGDMYLSGEDGNLYLYTSSGWKTVVLQ